MGAKRGSNNGALCAIENDQTCTPSVPIFMLEEKYCFGSGGEREATVTWLSDPRWLLVCSLSLFLIVVFCGITQNNVG